MDFTHDRKWASPDPSKYVIWYSYRRARARKANAQTPDRGIAVTASVIAVWFLMFVAAGAIVRLLYVRWRRMRRAAAILEELIAANRARPRPGMERRDDRLMLEAGRRRRPS